MTPDEIAEFEQVTGIAMTPHQTEWLLNRLDNKGLWKELKSWIANDIGVWRDSMGRHGYPFVHGCIHEAKTIIEKMEELEQQ